MTTEAKNRMIAEFMGHWAPMYYHEDWSKLMPVVERIESLGYTFKICRRRVEIDRDGEQGPSAWILKKEDNKFGSVYEAVVAFIQVHKEHN